MMLLAATSALDMVDADHVPPSVPKDCVDCKNPREGLNHL
jgi:hypothetical protein